MRDPPSSTSSPSWRTTSPPQSHSTSPGRTYSRIHVTAGWSRHMIPLVAQTHTSVRVNTNRGPAVTATGSRKNDVTVDVKLRRSAFIQIAGGGGACGTWIIDVTAETLRGLMLIITLWWLKKQIPHMILFLLVVDSCLFFSFFFQPLLMSELVHITWFYGVVRWLSSHYPFKAFFFFF